MAQALLFAIEAAASLPRNRVPLEKSGYGFFGRIIGIILEISPGTHRYTKIHNAKRDHAPNAMVEPIRTGALDYIS